MTDIDLYGIEKQPFLDFTESHAYLERVTVTSEDDAHRAFAEEYGTEVEEIGRALPIYMRYVTDANALADEMVVTVADVPCWLECSKDNPGAVPFWKEEA